MARTFPDERASRKTSRTPAMPCYAGNRPRRPPRGCGRGWHRTRRGSRSRRCWPADRNSTVPRVRPGTKSRASCRSPRSARPAPRLRSIGWGWGNRPSRAGCRPEVAGAGLGHDRAGCLCVRGVSMHGAGRNRRNSRTAGIDTVAGRHRLSRRERGADTPIVLRRALAALCGSERWVGGQAGRLPAGTSASADAQHRLARGDRPRRWRSCK